MQKGLRFLSLFTLPPFIIKIPILKLANRVLRYTTRKYYKEKIENVPVCSFIKDEREPYLIYIHGGGFFFSAPKAAIKEAKRYSDRTGMNVIFPDYTTSEISPYPASFNDLVSVLEHYKNKMLYIVGDSAGGALALELTSYAIKSGIKIEKLLLIYPVIDDKSNTESMKKYTHSPFWNSRANKIMWRLYLREGKGEYSVPSEIDNLSSFPPVFIEVEEFDSLHDEAVEFYNKLKKRGVEARLISNKGTYHGFDYFSKGKAVHDAKERRYSFLKD